MADNMVLVVSKVKEAIKAKGCNTAGDALDALNLYVGWIIEQAAKRAEANGRKTVKGHDILLPPALCRALCQPAG